VATIIAFMNVPIVYFSVKLLPSIHQLQSDPSTVDSSMHWPLRGAAFGFLFLGIGLVGMRARIAAKRMASEDEQPNLPPEAPELDLENA
jgi:heme exporter protein C